MLVTAEARLHEPYLLIGDWNTGAHRLDETGKTFVCAEQFAKLRNLGVISPKAVPGQSSAGQHVRLR